MKSLFTTFAALFAAPALIGLLAYLPPVQAADRVEEIRIAVPDVSAGSQPSGGGVVDVLRAQEIFEQEFAADGIKVQWSFFKGAGPVINEALANGQVDFAYLGDLAAIIGKANGLDTRLLSATARDIKHYLGVVPGSGIHTLADLKGKRVGIFRGTASQLSFDAALASQGLAERDLQVINLDFNAATAALAAKQIDATWGLSNLIALKARGVAELPLSTDDLGGVGSIQGVLVADGRFVDRHPEITARLVKAQQKAVTWLRDEHNKQAYIDLVSGLANYPTLILQNDLHNASFSKIFDPQLDAGFLGRLQQSVDLAAEQRLVRKGFVVADWAEPKFLDAALGERKAVAAAQ
ncbi:MULTISPECIES: ABC transporter substrate-binding protein [unclassified Pseudomonas]|uniref:ABC transporter substrate-binding protein n=1 Tax=unclassified Pseudomonas TaxID=196821 RepID=UPI002448431D|nr:MULTISPECIES: ABC transporter substrate-binding protein [unclassified Pseudomonas]MDH0896101.1 ABC transporter substrate-binding protein [Pseudomonas sp. GD03875]MDH1064804.1 ABC transporter substrate-binding protein [Pseudomonas sp. GD03985]